MPKKIPMILDFLKCYFSIEMQEGDAREQGKIIRPYFLLLKTNAKLYANQKIVWVTMKKKNQTKKMKN